MTSDDPLLQTERDLPSASVSPLSKRGRHPPTGQTPRAPFCVPGTLLGAGSSEMIKTWEFTGGGDWGLPGRGDACAEFQKK